MRKVVLSCLLCLINYIAYSQEANSIIKITNDIELHKISSRAYLHVSYINYPNYGRIAANGILLVNNKEAFLFDTPWNDSLTTILVKWINDSMNIKITGFIPNHWHEDCMGGLGFLHSQQVESYANITTASIAREKGLPVVKNVFKDSLLLQLADIQIACYYLGAAHTMDNIVIWVPSEKLLFPGCIVKSLNSGNLGNTADGDINAYSLTIEKLISKFPEAKIVVPGHGMPGGIELIRHTQNLAKSK